MENKSKSAQECLVEVMAIVRGLGKHQRTSAPDRNYNFRGIDATMNAVGPALREVGLVVLPDVRSYDYGEIETGRDRRKMGHARVVVEYTFVAPDGSTLVASAAGEAFDSGDKATAKAMSVAFRTVLLQSLCLPTDEPDPDASTYERSASPRDAVLAHFSGDFAEAIKAAENAGFTDLRDAAQLAAFAATLTEKS